MNHGLTCRWHVESQIGRPLDDGGDDDNNVT